MRDMNIKEKHKSRPARIRQGILKSDAGFTAVELIIAMGMALFVMVAFFNFYDNQSRLYVVHEQLLELQQNLRVAMYHMTRDIRMAGCDPRDSAGAGFDAASGTASIKFTMDIHDGVDNDSDGTIDNFNERDNVNGALNDRDESISYFLSGNNLVLNTAENIIAENISDLEFEYLDSSFTALAVTDVGQTRAVRIRVTAISDDAKYSKTMTSLVKCRNL